MRHSTATMGPLDFYTNGALGKHTVKRQQTSLRKTNFAVIAISVIVATTFLWIHPRLHTKDFEWTFSVNHAVSNAPVYIPPAKLVNASQFYLDPSWNLFAPPTIRTYNWSVFITVHSFIIFSKKIEFSYI